MSSIFGDTPYAVVGGTGFSSGFLYITGGAMYDSLLTEASEPIMTEDNEFLEWEEV